MSQLATPDLGQTEESSSSIHSPFLLTGKRQIWIVNTGKLDLFLVRLKQGEPVGARYHIVRLEEGQAFFGMPQDADGGLLVCPVPGSHFSQLDFPHSIEQASDEQKRLFSRLAAEWIEKLGVALAGPIVPKEALSIAPGQVLTIDAEEPPSLRPAEDLTWVLQSQGTARLFGDERYNLIPQNSLFPVTRYSWLQVSKASVLAGMGMDGWIASDPEWGHLETYHYLALAGMLIRRDQEEQTEVRRMEQRNDADQNRISRSIRKLAGPLAAKKSFDLSLESTSIDPLVLACEAVGKAMGVTMKVASGSTRATKQKEPISAIAKASGLRIRRVVLKGNWWKADGSPLLGAKNIDKSPVALLPTSGGRYRIYDPRTNVSELVTAKAAEQLSAFAYVFYRPFPARRLEWKDLLEFGLRGCGMDLSTMILMGVLTGLLGMLTPIFTGVIFDTLIPGAQRPELLQMGVILMACGICSALFALVRSFALLRMEGKVDASVQAAVWDRLLSLPVPFFRDYTAGDLAARGMGIDTIRQTLTGSTLNSILSSIFSVFSFGLLFWYSWRLALLATGLVLLATCISFACGILQIRHQRGLSKIRGRLSGAVLQFITGISKFRISGTETRAFSAWATDFSTQKAFAIRGRKVQNALSVFNAAFPILCSAAIFFYTAKIMADPAIPAVSKLTTGDFLAFNAAFVQFLTAMLQLSSSAISVLSIVPLYERAMPILTALPEVDEGKSDPGELSGAIEISHLAFRYREDTPLVLRDVSISIKPGQFVAFVGASGCGKSTLFRLLLGFEKPESGGIYYDQQDLGSIDVGAMRRQIGVVLQNGRVLSGDIFTNIVGSAALTVDDAWEAAKMAGMDGDIRNMPMGMHTVISEGGGGLSGGQKQRLMIARAIVGRPRILLFDEATSALDNHTQATVSRSLESLQATRIVIAHRLSTIINADQIVVLDKGVVAQSGTYAELIDQDGLFAELAKRQVT